MKLYRSIVNKILTNAKFSNKNDSKITGAELDFIVYVAQFQDEKGNVEGLNYKEVSAAIGIDDDYFYKILNNLSEKGIIQINYSRSLNGFWDIKFIDNDFSNGMVDFKKGYINLNLAILQSKFGFFRLSLSEKIIVLHIVKNMHRYFDEAIQESEEIRCRIEGAYRAKIDQLYAEYNSAKEKGLSYRQRRHLLFEISKLRQELPDTITKATAHIKTSVMPISFNCIANWAGVKITAAKRIIRRLSRVVGLRIEGKRVLVSLAGASLEHNFIDKAYNKTEAEVRNSHLIRYILKLLGLVASSKVVSDISRIFYRKCIKTLSAMYEALNEHLNLETGRASARTLNYLLGG